MCPVCLTATVDEPLGPRAELGGFTAVLHAPPGARVDVPYTIGVAAFAENLSVMGLMVDAIPLDELELGAPLQVQVVEPFAGGRTYGFRVADERR